MSIDSVDVRTLTTALLSVPKRSRLQAGLTKFGLFALALILFASYLPKNGNPELANVINTAQTVTYALV